MNSFVFLCSFYLYPLPISREWRVRIFMFYFMPLALVSHRKEICDRSLCVIKTSYLMSFFFVFVILSAGSTMPSLTEMYWFSNK